MPRYAIFFAFAVAILVGILGDHAPRARAGNGDVNTRNWNLDTAQDTDRTYKALRVAVAAADTLTTANILSLPSFQGGGRPLLYLQGRFSNASDSCTVQIAYVFKLRPQALSDTDVTSYTIIDSLGVSSSVAGNTIKHWSSVQTLTGATANPKETAAYYESNLLSLDMCRAVTVRVVVISKPTHSVDLWAGS